MKPTTESVFLKFMAKVSKAVDSKGEITPEDITPEMLSTDNFYQRIRLYGHSVKEVEQLIEEGKCIWAYGIDDVSAQNDEDISYYVDAMFVDKNGTEISKEALDNVEYILYSAQYIYKGVLLHKNNNDVFHDVSNLFTVLLLDNSYDIYVGANTF